MVCIGCSCLLLQYTVVELRSSRWYLFRLRAINSEGMSVFSKILPVGTAMDVPPPPPDLQVIGNSACTSALLRWRVPEDPSGVVVTAYLIEVRPA